jgi:hypothetical protein
MGDRYLPFTELHGLYLLAASTTLLLSSSRLLRVPPSLYLLGWSIFLRASTGFFTYLLVSSWEIGCRGGWCIDFLFFSLNLGLSFLGKCSIVEDFFIYLWLCCSNLNSCYPVDLMSYWLIWYPYSVSIAYVCALLYKPLIGVFELLSKRLLRKKSFLAISNYYSSPRCLLVLLARKAPSESINIGKNSWILKYSVDLNLFFQLWVISRHLDLISSSSRSNNGLKVAIR